MLKFFLNNTHIEEPDGVSGLSFSKKRHSKYFGFWGEVGLNQENASPKLTFTEPKAVAILKKEFDRKFIKSDITFKIEDCNTKAPCNELTYKVDFSDYEENENSVSITVRSVVADSIRSRVGVKYALTPITDFDIPTKSLEGTVTNEIQSALATVTVTTVGAIRHNIPLTGITDVFDIKQSIYKNDNTAKGIDVLGVLKWSAVSSVVKQYKVAIFILDERNDVVDELSTSDFLETSPTATIETKSFSVINYILQPFHSVVLRAYSVDILPDYTFTYQASENTTEGIIIRDHLQFSAFSTHKGILVKDVFDSIINKMSDNAIKPFSTFLSANNDMIITNGLNLKGIVSPINISLDEFFNGLNAILNIQLSINKDSVLLEKKEYKSTKETKFKGDYDITFMANKEYLYSSVKSGYKKWTSETNFGNDEHNSERQYSTDYTLQNSELDIQSEFIASHFLIEKIKRQAGKENASDTNDNDIIIVCVQKDSVGKYKAETSEDFTLIENVIYPNNSINLRISPARNLNRHRNYLYLSGDTIFESGSGNLQAESQMTDEEKSLIENQDFTAEPSPKLFGNKVAIITKYATLQEYCKLGETIEFEYCGKNYNGLLKSAEITISQETLLTLEVYV